MSMHPTINYFKEYKGDCTVFIETGTYRGEGMIAAREAGFHEIHSVDIIEHPDMLFKYDGVGTAKRYVDDSRNVLPWLLPKITGKIMFWLDGHSQLMEGEEDNFPLMGELAAIAKHCKQPPIIMVDDYLYMTHPKVTGWNEHDVLTALHYVYGDAFHLQYLPNPIKNNILLAYV